MLLHPSEISLFFKWIFSLKNSQRYGIIHYSLYGISLWTKINLKKRSDLPGEINSDIKNMCSNKRNATLKQKIMVQDNKKMWF